MDSNDTHWHMAQTLFAITSTEVVTSQGPNGLVTKNVRYSVGAPCPGYSDFKVAKIYQTVSAADDDDLEPEPATESPTTDNAQPNLTADPSVDPPAETLPLEQPSDDEDDMSTPPLDKVFIFAVSGDKKNIVSIDIDSENVLRRDFIMTFEEGKALMEQLDAVQKSMEGENTNGQLESAQGQ